MSQPGTVAAAIAFVPNWLAETADPAALDSLLAGWSKACGWTAAVLVWPIDGPAQVTKTVRGSELATPAAPPGFGDVAARLRGGPALVAAAGRLYAAFTPAGRSPGALWVERTSEDPFTD